MATAWKGNHTRVHTWTHTHTHTHTHTCTCTHVLKHTDTHTHNTNNLNKLIYSGNHILRGNESTAGLKSPTMWSQVCDCQGTTGQAAHSAKQDLQNHSYTYMYMYRKVTYILYPYIYVHRFLWSVQAFLVVGCGHMRAHMVVFGMNYSPQTWKL